jgi:hypothetical protein
MSATSHVAAPDKVYSIDAIENLPSRVRDIATLRGLGYSFREIAREFGVSPQAISLMLSRHRHVLKQLHGAVELTSLSARAVNALGRHGVRTREEALRVNVCALVQNERNCGEKTRDEIGRWLEAAGPGQVSSTAVRRRPGLR